MFCTRCGARLPDNVRFCTACGAPVSPAFPPAREVASRPASQQQPSCPAFQQPQSRPAPQPAPQSQGGARRLYFSTNGVSFVNYKFIVRDASGNELYTAATETVSMTRYAAKLYDRNRREVLTVEQQKKMTMMAMNFDMLVNGRVVTEILQIVKMSKYAFELPQMGISVDGDFIGHTYRFLYGGQLIGEVKRSMMSWGDAYEISFSDPNLEQPLLAAVLAVELVTIAQRSHRRRR